MGALLPNPEEGAQKSKRKSAGKRGRSQHPSDLPDPEEILRRLNRLSQLILLDLISPAKANAIHRVLNTMLTTHKKGPQGQGHGLSLDTLAELCRRDPQIVELLEPLLGDDEIAWLTGGKAQDSEDS